eukprot:1090101-Amorphochlora_amoeboformis.AAC.1
MEPESATPLCRKNPFAFKWKKGRFPVLVGRCFGWKWEGMEKCTLSWTSGRGILHNAAGQDMRYLDI